MQYDHAFHVTKNSLERGALFKSLHAENELYVAKICYEGDYKADLDAKKLDRSRIIMSFGPKKDVPEIAYLSGALYLRLDENLLVAYEQIDRTVSRILDGKESLAELRKLIDEYFPPDAFEKKGD